MTCERVMRVNQALVVGPLDPGGDLLTQPQSMTGVFDLLTRGVNDGYAAVHDEWMNGWLMYDSPHTDLLDGPRGSKLTTGLFGENDVHTLQCVHWVVTGPSIIVALIMQEASGGMKKKPKGAERLMLFTVVSGKGVISIRDGDQTNLLTALNKEVIEVGDAYTTPEGWVTNIAPLGNLDCVKVNARILELGPNNNCCRFLHRGEGYAGGSTLLEKYRNEQRMIASDPENLDPILAAMLGEGM